jgi:hypothetical protein
MEEVFPLTEEMNLLSETSRYALDNLLASQFVQSYGTKSNAKFSNNSNNTNTNNTCNNNTCSPLLSKKRQQSQPSFSRLQSAQGMEHSGTSKNHVNHENNLLLSPYIYLTIPHHYSLSISPVTIKTSLKNIYIQS